MNKITDEILREIIKSAAHDYTPEDIGDMYGISVAEVNDAINSNKSEIDAEKEYLKNIGNWQSVLLINILLFEWESD